MSDIFHQGTSWLADTVISHGSQKVSYAVDGQNPVPLSATIGRSMFRVEEDGVQKTVWTDRDFLFRVSDLRKIAPENPKLGDKINEVKKVAGQVIDRWYIVSAPQGEQPYRQADGRDNIIRVHTKLDSEEVIS